MKNLVLIILLAVMGSLFAKKTSAQNAEGDSSSLNTINEFILLVEVVEKQNNANYQARAHDDVNINGDIVGYTRLLDFQIINDEGKKQYYTASVKVRPEDPYYLEGITPEESAYGYFDANGLFTDKKSTGKRKHYSPNKNVVNLIAEAMQVFNEKFATSSIALSQK